MPRQYSKREIENVIGFGSFTEQRLNYFRLECRTATNSTVPLQCATTLALPALHVADSMECVVYRSVEDDGRPERDELLATI